MSQVIVRDGVQHRERLTEQVQQAKQSLSQQHNQVSNSGQHTSTETGQYSDREVELVVGTAFSNTQQLQL